MNEVINGTVRTGKRLRENVNLKASVRELRKRDRMCIGGNGGHFENLLYHSLLYGTLMFFHLFKLGLESNV